MVRADTIAVYSCPREQSHQTFLLLYGVTPSGVKFPLRAGCHCAEISGKWVARSFSPGITILPAHTGQSELFPALAVTVACHSWPLSHCHHTLRRVPATTSWGVKLPFLSGCHCRANSGWVAARSFSPGERRRLVQTGQPVPPMARDFTMACHSWPFSQIHHAL